MHPVLFSLFSYPIRSYGVFMTLAHLAGIAWILALARARREPIAPYLDLLFAVILAALVGARLDYALHHREEFQGWRNLFAVWRGGFSFFGGFSFGFLAFLLVLRWRKIPILPTADAVSPAFPFTLGLIRIGCFLEGCCYGAPTNMPWAVTYTDPESHVPLALLHRPLHPTQLYEAAFLFFLMGFLLLLLRLGSLRPGIVATLAVSEYATYRFVADFLRGDIARGLWGIEWLGITQAAALVGILATPLVLWVCARAYARQT